MLSLSLQICYTILKNKRFFCKSAKKKCDIFGRNLNSNILAYHPLYTYLMGSNICLNKLVFLHQILHAC